MICSLLACSALGRQGQPEGTFLVEFVPPDVNFPAVSAVGAIMPATLLSPPANASSASLPGAIATPFGLQRYELHRIIMARGANPGQAGDKEAYEVVTRATTAPDASRTMAIRGIASVSPFRIRAPNRHRHRLASLRAPLIRQEAKQRFASSAVSWRLKRGFAAKQRSGRTGSPRTFDTCRKVLAKLVSLCPT